MTIKRTIILTPNMDYETATHIRSSESKSPFLVAHSVYNRKSKTWNYLPGIWCCLYCTGHHSLFQQNFNAARKSPICVWGTFDDWAGAHSWILSTTKKGKSNWLSSMWNFLGISGTSSYWNPFGNFWAIKSFWEYVSFGNDDG